MVSHKDQHAYSNNCWSYPCLDSRKRTSPSPCCFYCLTRISLMLIPNPDYPKANQAPDIIIRTPSWTTKYGPHGQTLSSVYIQSHCSEPIEWCRSLHILTFYLSTACSPFQQHQSWCLHFLWWYTFPLQQVVLCIIKQTSHWKLYVMGSVGITLESSPLIGIFSKSDIRAINIAQFLLHQPVMCYHLFALFCKLALDLEAPVFQTYT
jgi:hypothetical protein